MCQSVVILFIHIEEGWKWLNLVEDPVLLRNHSKLLLHSRKLQLKDLLEK